MVMDKLYGENCSCCHVCEPRNTAEYATLFTPELMARLLADIFAGKFDEGREIYPALYEACRDTFRRALDEGYPLPEGADDAETLFREALRSDADVFAAFRTHRMQNDIASQLLDEDGKLKEWRQFREDAEAVIGTYNNHWLRTEYDTAVLRARQAADWKGFERNADILPNLKWMPTTSADPDLFHMEYWRIGLTLPISHPFWNSHHPGDRWNCKCSLEATDEPVTGSIPDAGYKPSPGLENNPGTDGKLFSPSHPYYEKAYPGAERASASVLRKKLTEWYKENLPTVKVGNMEMKRFEVATPDEESRTVINRKFYEETASKYKDSPDYAIRLEFARQAHLLFPKSVHVRDEVPRDHDDALAFRVYQYRTGEFTIEFKCKVNGDGCFLHFMRLL